MRRYLLIFFSALIMFFVPGKKENTEVLSVASVPIYSSSYVVLERSSYKVLEGNEINKTQSVASISKIMTAIVAIENVNLEDLVTIPPEIKEVYGSMLYIHEGDKIPIIDLLYGLMLRSGNDAAVSIAIHVAGTIEKFVEMMNQKAAILKMEHSLFRNPHGLDEEDDGNISCAYDMALLHAYALNNPIYRQITSAKQYKTYKNKNRLISMYEYTTGGKTGFTKKARRTLVTSALKDDLELIVVTLNCGNDFETHKNIYEYYFSRYMGLIILKHGINYIDSYCVNVDKEYIFMVCIEDADRLYLKYEIIKGSKQLTIYLLDKNNYIVEQISVDLSQLPQKK